MTNQEKKLASKIERLLESDEMSQYRAADLIAWAFKFKKLPPDLLDAFIEKTTKIFTNNWYEIGGEAAQGCIDEYLYGK